MIKRILKALFIACLALSLSHCGGGSGSSNTQLAEGGISGTGITTVGAITGFGSIWVNGIRYDVSKAQFFRDGALASGQQSYQIGEIIQLEGLRNADGVSGEASTIRYSNTLIGTVTTASTDNSSITVLGQTIYTDGLTILHGFEQLSDLQAGNLIAVSARIDAQQHLIASSITLQQTQFIAGVHQLKLRGSVSALNTALKQFSIGDLTVNYANAVMTNTQSILNGMTVEVLSAQALQNGLLIANQVTAITQTVLPAGTQLEIEGVISQQSNASLFSVNGQVIITSTATVFEDGTAQDVQLNALIEAEGTIDQQGRLLASKIEFKRISSSASSQEWEGRIDHIDHANNTITINNLIFMINNTTIIREEVNDREITLTVSTLAIGDNVEVYGRLLSDGRILALRIERETEDD